MVSGTVEPPIPSQALLACGWLAEEELADPRLTIESLSRAHVVHRVRTPDGRAAVVKHATPAARADGRDLAREFFVYRVGGWLPAVGAALATPLLIDEHRGILALRSLSANAAWPRHAEEMSVRQRRIARDLARIMARYHRGTTSVPFWPSPADGILALPDAIDVAVEGRPPLTQQFIRSLGSAPDLAAALRDLRATYRRLCLIHGDIRSDNWGLDTASGRAVLVLLDWEMAGLGDPAWDVGSVLAEAIVDSVRSGITITSGQAGWPAPVARVACTFLRAYGASAGLVDMSAPDDRMRVVLSAAARLLHVSTEWAEYEANVTEAVVDPLVNVARHLCAQRDVAAEALGLWSRS
jgi:hypothetical protein